MAKCRCTKKVDIHKGPNNGGKIYKMCFRCGQLWVKFYSYNHYRTTTDGALREIGFYERGGWANNKFPYRLIKMEGGTYAKSNSR